MTKPCMHAMFLWIALPWDDLAYIRDAVLDCWQSHAFLSRSQAPHAVIGEMRSFMVTHTRRTRRSSAVRPASTTSRLHLRTPSAMVRMG